MPAPYGTGGRGRKRSQRLSELEDVLRRREHEFSDERRARDAEREQFQSNQQALLLRIETLERSAADDAGRNSDGRSEECQVGVVDALKALREGGDKRMVS